MLFKDIKVGKTYEVKSLGEIVRVKVTEKLRTKDFCRVEYEYPEMNMFGCTKGWQFDKAGVFTNMIPVS
jgi:hypothetical protein